eukprot:4458498-Pleurochrysis_carterae.AAC.3
MSCTSLVHRGRSPAAAAEPRQSEYPKEMSMELKTASASESTSSCLLCFAFAAQYVSAHLSRARQSCTART